MPTSRKQDLGAPRWGNPSPLGKRSPLERVTVSSSTVRGCSRAVGTSKEVNRHHYLVLGNCCIHSLRVITLDTISPFKCFLTEETEDTLLPLSCMCPFMRTFSTASSQPHFCAPTTGSKCHQGTAAASPTSHLCLWPL